MASHSNSREIPFGAVKLSQDIATLLNSRQGSDIQFRVGGGILTQGNNDISATATLYAHSLILRCRSSYFAAMLDREKNWKECSNGVIYKPNISPVTFQDVLYYLYTGNIRTSGNIVELIAAADEMNLEELSVECQNKLIRTVKYLFSEEDERSTNQCIPIDVAVSTHIIPALNLASSHSLSNLFQEVLTIILPHMSAIIRSPDAYTTFIKEISSEALIKIISSDDLVMTEDSVWDLTLSWACHQTELSKTAVEACLNNTNDDEDSMELFEGATISDIQLKRFKEVLTPLLPFIRFSLFDPDDYGRMANTFIFILPRRRYLEINQFFVSPSTTRPLDTPRKKQKIPSKIVIGSSMWKQLRKEIFEAGGISGCLSSNDLKFELLFRASVHGFLSSTFHQRCDNKGPTLTIIRSADGYLFGGVNFNHWNTDCTSSSSISNFLFSLPDGRYRKNSAIFKIKENRTQYSFFNFLAYGPTFGGGTGFDLYISDSANTNQLSHSDLPCCYGGSGASNTALAGSHYFIVSDYDVFAISK